MKRPGALSFSLLLLNRAAVTDATRVVAFKFLEGTGSCAQSDTFNMQLGEFHVDCGNANHGCTPGHNMMIYGDFYAADTFETVVDVDIKACEFGSLICTPNFVETEMNFCYDLNVLDFGGYQVCNQVGNYSFEKSYTLPSNHTWYEDFAFDGLKFNLVVLLEDALVCQASFVTRVYYTYEAWMSWAAGSLALVGVLLYYLRHRQQQQRKPKIHLSMEDAKTADINPSQTQVVKSLPKGVKTTPVIQAIRSQADADESVTTVDDESVTTTAYKRMLDFSPTGLAHLDYMEQVRHAHFERLRQTRESRRSTAATVATNS